MQLKKPHRFRVVLLGGLFLGLTLAVGARLYQLQFLQHEHYTTKAHGLHYTNLVIHPDRGDILDRNGIPLAQSTGRFSVFINPRLIAGQLSADETAQLANRIAAETGEYPEEIASRLASTRVAPLARRVSLSHAQHLAAILREYNPDGRGYWMDRESQRLYPTAAAAPVIGFCQRGSEGDTDGLAGVELSYDEQLKGRKATTRTRHSPVGQRLEPIDEDDLLAARGNTLVLTLDARIQEATEKALLNALERHNADSGGAVVMDPSTGAVIAMASVPTFDNNAFGAAPAENRRNRTLTDPLETGSVVKLFTAAILIDKGYVTPETIVDCENGFAVVDGRRLQDSPGNYLGVATFREALRKSSNIGIVKVALALENREWYAKLRDLNFGAPTGIDLPGEGSGILYPVERWTRLSRTSLPMGYEIALTPVQIAAAISTLVNGGVYYQPHLVSEIRDPSGEILHVHGAQPVRRVFRPTTSAIMRDLMEDAAELGTGRPARIEGYRIGGKTGTTRKSNIFDRREYIASFGGALPINDPRVVIYVYIDNPKGEYYGGQVAAPVFREIARACALHLGITPSKPGLSVPAQFPFYTPPDIADNERQSRNATLAFLGRMPDFHGMPMREVRESLPRDLERATFLGSGLVTDQYPAPGEPLNETTEVVIHFSAESNTLAGSTDTGRNGGTQ